MDRPWNESWPIILETVLQIVAYWSDFLDTLRCIFPKPPNGVRYKRALSPDAMKTHLDS